MTQTYHLRPLVKKGPPTSDPLRVPQYSGTPGWIFLTHDKNGVAHAGFSDSRTGRTEEIPIVIDERLCCDTILRVVRLGPGLFVVYDLVVLNGVRVHETLNYQQRKERIYDLLDIMHFPDLSALIKIEDVPVGNHVRGYEIYDCFPGSIGTFVDPEHLPTIE